MSETLADGDGLRLNLDGRIAALMFTRPEKRNALSQGALRRLPDMLALATDHAAIDVLVVTGGAGHDFSAGAQIDEFDAICADDAAVARFAATFARAQTAMEAFPKPSVAMISGACIGGGCGLALGCDVRFADDAARFGITPAKLGLAYGLADTRRLVEAVGFAHAADLLMSGRLIEAAEALRIGLATAIVPAGELVAHTRRWAEQVAGNPPEAVRGLKALLCRVRAGARDDDEASRAAFVAAFAGPVAAERRRDFTARSKASTLSKDTAQ